MFKMLASISVFSKRVIPPAQAEVAAKRFTELFREGVCSKRLDVFQQELRSQLEGGDPSVSLCWNVRPRSWHSVPREEFDVLPVLKKAGLTAHDLDRGQSLRVEFGHTGAAISSGHPGYSLGFK